MRWPRPSTGYTRLRWCIGGHGVRCRTLSSRRSNGCTGTTTIGCSARSGTCRRQKRRELTIGIWRYPLARRSAKLGSLRQTRSGSPPSESNSPAASSRPSTTLVNSRMIRARQHAHIPDPRGYELPDPDSCIPHNRNKGHDVLCSDQPLYTCARRIVCFPSLPKHSDLSSLHSGSVRGGPAFVAALTSDLTTSEKTTDNHAPRRSAVWGSEFQSQWTAQGSKIARSP